MQITIIAGGSRGDVQPYVALGKGLQEAGHRVHLLTSDDFETLVMEHGLAFFTTGGSAEAVAREMQTLSEQGNMLKILSQMRLASEKQAVQAAIKGLAACQGSDLILGGLSGLFSGQALSERRRDDRRRSGGRRSINCHPFLCGSAVLGATGV